MKTKLLQGLFPDVELLKMFSIILNVRKADRAQNVFFENNAKYRVTHFNISVAVIKSLTVLNLGFHYDFV